MEPVGRIGSRDNLFAGGGENGTGVPEHVHAVRCLVNPSGVIAPDMAVMHLSARLRRHSHAHIAVASNVGCVGGGH